MAKLSHTSQTAIEDYFFSNESFHLAATGFLCFFVSKTQNKSYSQLTNYVSLSLGASQTISTYNGDGVESIIDLFVAIANLFSKS